MGITGAALATFLGLLLSFVMGVVYFVTHPNFLHFTFHGLSIKEAFHSMVNGTSEFVNQLAIAITTVVFNRSALLFAGEDGVAAVSIIMYLQFLCIGIYFGFSMGLSMPLGYAYGDRNFSVCRVLEKARLSLLCNCTDHSLRMHLSAGTNWGTFLCISRQHSL